jgi:hypothetical protein
MTAPTKSIIKNIYYRHGLFTFLLFFVPILPGFIESHTTGYLAILEAHHHNPAPAKDTLQMMFGARGVNAYEHFIRNNPLLIRPPQVFRKFYLEKSPQIGTKLFRQAMTDPLQRQYPESDIMRATLIREIPTIFSAYNQPEFQAFRSQLIRLSSKSTITEEAIEPKLAYIDIAQELITKASATTRQIRQLRINAELNLLSAKIKAQLAGAASPFTAPYRQLLAPDRPTPQITHQDINLMVTTLHQLSYSPAKEISTKADTTQFHLQHLKVS